jgi:hypothetical protein
MHSDYNWSQQELSCSLGGDLELETMRHDVAKTCRCVCSVPRAVKGGARVRVDREARRKEM